jgi:hypothetical protein
MAFGLILSFASCKKDYTCACVTDDGQGNKVNSSITIHTTKKKAKDACTAQESVSGGGTTFTTTCSVQ